MRSLLALQLSIAHGIGLIAVAIVATLSSANPSLDEAVALLAAGGVMSLFVFLPVLALSVMFAPWVYANLLKYVVIGPIALSAFGYLLAHSALFHAIAISAWVSSAALFVLVRLDNPMGDFSEG